MKLHRWILISLLVLITVSCGRSKESQYYILNSLPAQNHSRIYQHLKIGIDEVAMPDYIERTQLVVNYTPHQVKIEEFHQWAESLDQNVKRVIATNLSMLLPGAVVENLPWDSKFKPTYHIQINIIQYSVDVDGNSILRAGYIVYHDKSIIKKRQVYYHIKLQQATTESMVSSMNTNLNRLSCDIADYFKHMK